MKNILWLDLETTGLDENNCHILELGMVLTDHNLVELATFQSAIWQPDVVLANMNGWCKKTHGASGLIESCQDGRTPSKRIVEGRAMGFLRENEIHRPVLAGSSVHFDLRFLKKHMPNFAGELHYRIMDVSSVMELFSHMYGFQSPGSGQPAHRVLDDIRYSIDQMKTYRQYFKSHLLRNDVHALDDAQF